MTAAELFHAFGGKEGVMAATGNARNTVTHWLHAGVPWRHWPALRTYAAEHGIPGITDEALAGTRPVKPAKRKRRQNATSPRCAA